MYKVSAIDTSNGNHTACSEAVLCENHDTTENRTKLETGLYHGTPVPPPWGRVDDNGACRCCLC